MLPTKHLPASPLAPHRPIRKLLSPPNSINYLQCPTPLFTPHMFLPPTEPPALTGLDTKALEQNYSRLSLANQHAHSEKFENKTSNDSNIPNSKPTALQPMKAATTPKEYVVFIPPPPQQLNHRPGVFTVDQTNKKLATFNKKPNQGAEELSPKKAIPPLTIPSRTICIPRILPVKRKRIRPETPSYHPCHVCGDTAGRHSYYGGQACTSCRAFFRRAVQSEYCFAYICLKDKECIINIKSRKKCQYCRYQACLAAGMKTTWVLNEEEKTKFLEGRRKNKKPEPDVFKEPAPPPRLMRPVSCISEEELLEVKNYVKTSGYFDISKVRDMDNLLLRELIR